MEVNRIWKSGTLLLPAVNQNRLVKSPTCPPASGPTCLEARQPCGASRWRPAPPMPTPAPPTRSLAPPPRLGSGFTSSQFVQFCWGGSLASFPNSKLMQAASLVLSTKFYCLRPVWKLSRVKTHESEKWKQNTLRRIFFSPALKRCERVKTFINVNILILPFTFMEILAEKVWIYPEWFTKASYMFLIFVKQLYL